VAIMPQCTTYKGQPLLKTHYPKSGMSIMPISTTGNYITHISIMPMNTVYLVLASSQYWHHSTQNTSYGCLASRSDREKGLLTWSSNDCIPSVADLKGKQPLHLPPTTHTPKTARRYGHYKCEDHSKRSKAGVGIRDTKDTIAQP